MRQPSTFELDGVAGALRTAMSAGGRARTSQLFDRTTFTVSDPDGHVEAQMTVAGRLKNIDIHPVACRAGNEQELGRCLTSVVSRAETIASNIRHQVIRTSR